MMCANALSRTQGVVCCYAVDVPCLVCLSGGNRLETGTNEWTIDTVKARWRWTMAIRMVRTDCGGGDGGSQEGVNEEQQRSQPLPKEMRNLALPRPKNQECVAGGRPRGPIVLQGSAALAQVRETVAVSPTASPNETARSVCSGRGRGSWQRNRRAFLWPSCIANTAPPGYTVLAV